MTDLVVRKIDFDLDGDVPFLWNPSNPAFSLQANAISFLAIAFEKFVVAAVREAMPQIEDPEVLEIGLVSDMKGDFRDGRCEVFEEMGVLP